MKRSPLRALGLAAVVVACASCGAERLDASFTSRIVQRDTCRTSGDHPEVCTRADATTDVRVRVVETEDAHLWLSGVPRDGVTDRVVLGSYDVNGGMLFVDERVQSNEATGCVLVNRLEIAVAIPPDVEASRIGTDACVPLLGRETSTTTSSAGCDGINVPPLQVVRVDRRRWEAPPECGGE
jgi:hypothetical protein